ncbi:hypothetical protein [Sagittula sp.]|uniref:hypothetical protein n=1 Tax=Sagittula sp. TaxID=2038081 RepID=UPI00351969C6
MAFELVHAELASRVHILAFRFSVFAADEDKHFDGCPMNAAAALKGPDVEALRRLNITFASCCCRADYMG